MRRRLSWASGLLGLLLAACGDGASSPWDVYDQSAVVELHLEFSDDQWAQFLEHRRLQQKAWVHCSFTYDGETFPDAACRSKGDPATWARERKPQFAIKFNEWVKGARFRGLRGLNLEANMYDDAPVRDRLAMWLFREAGVVAPRVNHARVFRSGEYLGVYQNIERIDKDFLVRNFEDPEGNLYDEGTELETNETENDLSRLMELAQTVELEPLDGDHTAFNAKLAALVNISQVLREMAVETVLPTADNFSNGSTNFYYYDDPLRGFTVLPWDLDTIFDDFAPADADPYAYWGGEIQNPPNKMRQLMNLNPVWQREFTDALVEIRDGPYARLPDQVDAYCSQIRSAVDADPNKAGDLGDFDWDCEDIKARIAQRIAWLTATLRR